jgi:Uma2 family endonuclease
MAIPEEDRFHEILDGELVQKEMTSAEHSLSQRMLGAKLDGFHGKANGPSRPGGWWLLSEPTIRLSEYQTVRPDLAGWRRDRMPERPTGYPIHLRPDWICEIHLKGDARRRDTLQKRRIYAEHNIPHYWLLDGEREVVCVLRLVGGGYQDVLEVGRGATFHAEPFGALELSVDVLFGHE